MSDPTLTRGADPSYREALLAELGDADPIAELSALFERLPQALQGLDEASLRRPEAEGKWSILQVVQHLADVELVQGLRIRRILAEDHPTLVSMDQDRWAATLWGPRADLEDALEPLCALRLANLRLVTGLDEGELERTCLHPERGEETLGTVLKLVAGHDRVHLAQIRRVREAIGAAPAEDAGSDAVPPEGDEAPGPASPGDEGPAPE